MRPATVPIFGPDAAQCSAQRSWHSSRELASSVSRILVAGSADLAVTWGDLRRPAADEPAQGAEGAEASQGGWLRVWRKDSVEDAWRVLAEVVLPAP
jgi:hypothetical protein